MSRKAVTVLVALIVGIGGGVVAFRAFQVPIGEAIFERVATARMDMPAYSALGDGLHVGLCGSGSPFPDTSRAGPCTFVKAADRLFVVDIGGGSTRLLGSMGVPIDEIDAILLTHFHSDHLTDLGDAMLLRWAGGGHDQPLPIYGPPGVSQVVEGFEAAYALDRTYRIAHHGPDVVPPSGFGGEPRPFDLSTDDSVVVFEEDGLRISAFSVSHDPIDPVVGYRFDYQGRSVVISGDTTYNDNLVRVAQGVDLLIHDALQVRLVEVIREVAVERGNEDLATILFDIQDYHATPEDAARAARNTGAQMLVLHHVVPPLPSRILYPAYVGEARNHFGGPIVVGEDGMVFSLPPGSDEIVRERF
jgi:ribonuclease Z